MNQERNMTLNRKQSMFHVLSMMASTLLLTSCASSKPYLSPTAGALASITFATENSELEQLLFHGDMQARVSEKSCAEINGATYNDSFHTLVPTSRSTTIPAGKEVFFSWVQKGGGRATGHTITGYGGIKYDIRLDEKLGGMFIPEEGATYESRFGSSKGRTSMKLYKITQSGKVETSYTSCQVKPHGVKDKSLLYWF
jgi:hypothetical protein